MMKKSFAFIIAIILAIGVFAQRPEELLESWSVKSPIEKVYIHFDRTIYRAGETAWFKAYLYSEFFSDTISTSLYIELLDKSSRIISQKIAPVIFGNAMGQFELSDSLQTGTYFVRAWSPTILNQNHDFIYEKQIQIIGKSNLSSSATLPKTQKLHFFAESGNFVAGFPNTVVFKYTDEFGMPKKVSGVIKNEKDETIISFSDYHDGMGMFDIKPLKGVRYYALLNNDPYEIKYFLPDVVAGGLVLKLIPTNGGKDFEIYQNSDDSLMRGNYMIGQMQHKVVFKVGLNTGKNEINGFINTQQLRSGIMQVTVFNKDGMPLAERICFVDNKEYVQPAELITDTLNFAARGKNSFTFSLPDSIAGSFSVAITDPDFSLNENRKENIISSLLLTGDLKGQINNPIYYFSSNDDSVSTALDILMMINGWTRFNWSKLADISKAPLRYADKGYISITGHINLRNRNKPLTENELLVLLFSLEDSTNTSMQLMETDHEGKFAMDSLIFFGNTRFYISDILEKKNKWIDIFPDEDSINTSYSITSNEKNRFLMPLPGIDKELNSKFANEYAHAEKEDGLMLKGVTVKIKKKTPLEEMEERYSNGLFTGSSVQTIDLVNTEEKLNQNNIFDYIQGRISGINVQRTGMNYQLFYRQRRSLMSGPIPMTLFLNEIETPANFIATIPANQIAMLKIFTSFVGTEGNGVGGVLAIYTKQSSDMVKDLTTGSDIFQYKGYSIIKEFYTPDYSDIKDLEKAKEKDQRITLHWQPNVIMDGTALKVPIQFYNNDRTKSFKIIIEGITDEGKIVFLEKVISPKTRGF